MVLKDPTLQQIAEGKIVQQIKPGAVKRKEPRSSKLPGNVKRKYERKHKEIYGPSEQPKNSVTV